MARRHRVGDDGGDDGGRDEDEREDLPAAHEDEQQPRHADVADVQVLHVHEDAPVHLGALERKVDEEERDLVLEPRRQLREHVRLAHR